MEIFFVDCLPRENGYMKYVSQILEKFPKWREERLPPPRVNQSEVMINVLIFRETEVNCSCSMTKLGSAVRQHMFILSVNSFNS